MKAGLATGCSVGITLAVLAAAGVMWPRHESAPRPEVPASAAEAAPADTALVPIAEQVTPALDRGQLAREMERALVASDPRLRETALQVLLPVLVREEPQRAARMLASLPPGESRELLREEITRQWIRHDHEAALDWIDSLGDQAERRSSAVIAMRTFAARSAEQAIAVADRFGVGRDDGSLEHLVQIWAAEDPLAARQWIEAQPPESPGTSMLRARIDQVLARGR
jgi:hypothetical protein